MFYSFFKLRDYYKHHEIRQLPFLPSRDRRIKIMLELSGLSKGDRSADLGSGDGRVVAAFAKAGARATGIEIDGKLAEISRHNLKKEISSGKAVILNSDFWTFDLTPFNIITVYGIGSIMWKLREKLDAEVENGVRIICNFFPLPDWKPVKTKENVYLYLKK